MAAAAALLLPMASAYLTSSTYCRESTGGGEDVLNFGCPETWPDTLCTTDSGTTPCKCRAEDVKGTGCVIDEAASSGTSGRCEEVLVRVTSTTPMSVVEGSDFVGASSADETPEVTEVIYCRKMVYNGDWGDYTRSGTDDDPDVFEETCWCSGWWGCDWVCFLSWKCWWDSLTTWENERCYDSDRYLGEYCSDELWCKGGSDEYATSCLDNVCVMKASATYADRRPCDCNWFDWYLGFACASDTCNGHACVLTTGGGGGGPYFCDLGTKQGGPVQWFR